MKHLSAVEFDNKELDEISQILMAKKKVMNKLEIDTSKEYGFTFLEIMADDLKYFEIAKSKTMNRHNDGVEGLEDMLYDLYHNKMNK